MNLALSISLIILLQFVALSQQQEGALHQRQKYNASDFAFDLFGSRPNVRSTGGSAQRVAVEDLPALKGLGVSSVIFRMLPCAINLPHVHPRGTELFHVLEGNFITGFLEENNGRYLQNNLTVGMVTIFPQGLIHFEQNVGCTNATFLSAFSSEDAGVVQIINRFFDIEFDEAITSTLNQDQVVVDYLKKSIGTNPTMGRGECLKRCGLA
jgi:oxalate decarboxylase/phosphoglucose isomerase-like protein (cupin superfamily)